MKIRLINDCHQHGPHQLFKNIDDLFFAIVNSPYPVFGLGDNIDMKNCKKRDVEMAQSHIKRCVELTKQHNARFGFDGDTWLDGNHELGFGTNIFFAFINSTVLTHGHIPQWSEDKVDEWEKKEAGAGWFKRNFVVRGVAAARHLLPPSVSEDTLEWIDTNLRPESTQIIMGHKHPKELLIYKHDGRTIIYLPRGVNDVEV